MGAMKEVSYIDHLKSILLLPFIATVVIPLTITYMTRDFIAGMFMVTKTVEFVGWAVLSLGLFLFMYCVFLFVAFGRGTLAPWNPAQNLILRGPYKYVRNPMIVGVTLMIIGDGLLMGLTPIVVWAFVFVCINHIYFVSNEEPKLKERFGDEYISYMKRVPRWLPRFKRFF